jgi:hypothetical protein
MENPPKCAHRACDCLARQASRYCGTECEAAVAAGSSDCSCGHKACASSLGSEAARDAGKQREKP